MGRTRDATDALGVEADILGASASLDLGASVMRQDEGRGHGRDVGLANEGRCLGHGWDCGTLALDCRRVRFNRGVLLRQG